MKLKIDSDASKHEIMTGQTHFHVNSVKSSNLFKNSEHLLQFHKQIEVCKTTVFLEHAISVSL